MANPELFRSPMNWPAERPAAVQPGANTSLLLVHILVTDK
jgi:hypothetical protein